MDRRSFIGRAAALATVGLAGCTGGGDGGATEGPAQVVDVGPDGSLRFEPASFEIAAGETVRWVFRSGGHNVKAESVPDGADWSGTPGGEFETLEEGATHVQTFDVAGDYEYFCGPHRTAGMVGSFTVTG